MNANDNTSPERRAKPEAKSAKVCPNCGKPRSERYDPFCSKRCADVDLHRWLKGGYVIPGGSASKEPGGDDD